MTDADLGIPHDAPEPLVHYLRMWNERDLDRIRVHLDRCVSDDCIWIDPLHQHVGRDALETNVRGFRTEFADAILGLGSNIDSHNGRHRYEWVITAGPSQSLLMRGFDVATIDDAGMINRVDGFFGMLERFGPQ